MGGQKPVKTTFWAGWQKATAALLICAALVALGFVTPAMAQDKGQLFVTQEEGYARLILSFPSRDSLPPYSMRLENGVLSIEFTDPADIMLPDVSLTLPDYVSVARVDPDRRGLRLGLRAAFNFNRIEAGEKLFIDLLPSSWQGMPPALPQDVIDDLAERARLASIKAEQDRKAAAALELQPAASVRIGRNPTFLRLQFDWTIDTKAEFAQDKLEGLLAFEWPVAIDLTALEVNLPPEIVSVTSEITADGNMVYLELAEGVQPRFYQNSPRQVILDIDLGGASLPPLTTADLAAEVDAQASAAVPEAGAETAIAQRGGVDALYPATVAGSVTPFISVLGSTVRVVFPFAQDTPAAVFRRGDTVWMMFDTMTGIARPAESEALDALVSDFAVVAAGDTQVVRLELSQERLATLGSEGMAWVLSLGDIMLTPTEPIQLNRRRNIEGLFEMTADVVRPGRVHEFRDPVVGDVLQVVTAYPPARGLTRNLDYVDFAALRTVHGMVLKPKNLNLNVAIENQLAVISTNGGLTVSALDQPRAVGASLSDTARASYVDLRRLEEVDTGAFNKRRAQLFANAASSEGRGQDVARLELAQYLLANRFAHEAIGLLRVLEGDLEATDLTRKVRMSLAIANTVANRPNDALKILNASSMAQDTDALMWRTIARADAHDFKGARLDALESQSVTGNYPLWVRNRFALAATRGAVESGDARMAEHLLGEMDFANLNAEEASLYHLLAGRADEAQGRMNEAIDTYGQVISADIRPTRAEAIYRTLSILDGEGKLNLSKATETLAAEAMLWRGDALEADMQKMLAELYFRDGAYRPAFETVKQAVANYPESASINALRDEAQKVFAELFLDGRADALGPVDALGIYYDFRHLTPSGVRGDEMIRNLARRLVKVDLLAQAAELLDYQLQNRLRGVARTQIAADLAIIYLADRRPQDALRVLNQTQLPDLPAGLVRQRRILEARALIDGGRDQLGLDLLRTMSGRDADLLRIDAHWRGKRYSQASEMLEAMYAQSGVTTTLGQPARMSIIKAAVGYVLSNDRFGLSRLRTKFGDRMVTTPEWPMFDFVTGDIETTSLEFKRVAREVSGLDSLNAFLASYRETYGSGGALAPLTASKGDQTVASLN
ncbi:hypothetical protein VW29_08265 [Devosia limi DSM 17137]|uniref:Tetratricopeptide repeat-containing protein n=1 Tax=Devosia limi DSM 17137 TaxID=1121477 RepID=A0A0F5LT45_9HYPH|nr:hypothetical protein VW29_08265 [Devosia limi DSM 17137]SHF09399.1 hypothetical protein SAMN02745223_01814 [Devosia limi DSM 17137]